MSIHEDCEVQIKKERKAGQGKRGEAKQARRGKANEARQGKRGEARQGKTKQTQSNNKIANITTENTRKPSKMQQIEADKQAPRQRMRGERERTGGQRRNTEKEERRFEEINTGKTSKRTDTSE